MVLKVEQETWLYKSRNVHLFAWCVYQGWIQDFLQSGVQGAQEGLHATKMITESYTKKGKCWRIQSLRRGCETPFTQPLDRSRFSVVIFKMAISLQGGSDISLTKGQKLKLSTDKAMYDQCTSETIFVDYPNIVKVVPINGIVYVDDGLISLKVLFTVNQLRHMNSWSLDRLITLISWSPFFF